MSVAKLIETLSQQGVQLWVDRDKLRIQAPKGVLIPQLRDELAERKPEILAYLQQQSQTQLTQVGKLAPELSLQTIGRLIGGFSQERTTRESFKSPVIDPKAMARQLKVTFRPLPEKYTQKTVLEFRQSLEQKLRDCGVNIIPWEQATRELRYDIKLPLINRQRSMTTKVIKSEISAVIDVERVPSLKGQLKSWLAETLYSLYTKFILKSRKLSATRIAQTISWAEDHIQNLEDPTNTQAIVLTELDEAFINPALPYQEKIPLGVNALVRTFSQILIGVSEEKVSILNMNLSDSTYPIHQVDSFIANSLIPKIYVPILPLPISQFEVGEFEPRQSPYAQRLVQLGQALITTELLPEGFKIDDVVKKKSHRDIVDWITNGRTGVSYGFIAYTEPPQYVGAVEITSQQWETLLPLPALNNQEVRQNDLGRRYIKTKVDTHYRYQQIPDIWLVSSRSGANKTHLNLETDVVRIGLQERLLLQLPQGSDLNTDVKPSYDLYVMVAIALASALYAPKLMENGAPIVHFHGYPSKDWFESQEYCAGASNPSLPCGTYESGVFNFLGIYEVAKNSNGNLTLASLIEPDHGTNIIAYDLNYLLDRLLEGCRNRQIELGGKFYASLKRDQNLVSCYDSSGGESLNGDH